MEGSLHLGDNMTFSFTTDLISFEGKYVVYTGTWNAAGATSGNIDITNNRIVHSEVMFKTSARGVVDDTTTAGRIALTSVTSDDTGRWEAKCA